MSVLVLVVVAVFDGSTFAGSEPNHRSGHKCKKGYISIYNYLFTEQTFLNEGYYYMLYL